MVASIPKMRLVVLAVVCAALSRIASADPAAPVSQAPVKVAVIPSITVHLDAARADALAEELAVALHAELDVDAIGGVEVRRRLPAEGLAPDCIANPTCIADAARWLGVDQLLFVVMIDTGSGGVIQVDATWVDPQHHKSASRPAIDLAALGDARIRFAAAARQLLPDAPVRPRPPPALGRMSEAVPRHFATASYVTAGATVAGLGLGLSLGLVTRGRYQDCEDGADRGMACSSGRKDAIRRLALIADAGWVVAIAGTVATAVLYATSGEASHIVVEPVPGGAMVTAAGRF